MAWRREGRCRTVVERADGEAAKELARKPADPTMAERVHAEPCVLLAGHDPLRIVSMRTKWNSGYAK